jgi:hypothetical protein
VSTIQTNEAAGIRLVEGVGLVVFDSVPQGLAANSRTISGKLRRAEIHSRLSLSSAAAI